MVKIKNNAKIMLLFSTIIMSVLAIAVIALTSSNSPTACGGQWTSCSNAFADDASRATASPSQSGRWNNYGFSTGNGAIINNVTIRADFFATRTSGFINVKVSGDNGATYGPGHVVGGNTAEQTFIIDVTNDLNWTPSMLSNSNFRVNVTCTKQGGGANPTCDLDWVPVNVTYTPFDFSVSSNPSNSSVIQGSNATTTATATLLSGNSQTVSLSYSGCPTNALCSFNPSSGTPTYNSVFTIQTATPNGTTPAGTYNITLSGFGDGKTRSTNYALTVTNNSLPLASASAVPTSGFAPLTVNFTGSVTGGNAPLSYLWNFNDTSLSSEQNPVHTFNLSGNYNVSFKVTDFNGDSSTDYILITAS